MRGVIGWDIGGVNTKVARVAGGRLLGVRSRPFEIQRAPDALAPLLRDLAREVGAASDDRHAVTMTAELSQFFRTKADGVRFVLDAAGAAFPDAVLRVLDTAGRFVTPEAAGAAPLTVAASNWMATAAAVARRHPDAILLDTGSTTTDIIPIVGGQVAAAGRTDPDRLASGELVYTGAVRTPVEAIVRAVPWRGASARVSAEGFALAGDAHLWLGTLDPAAYEVTPPDGRPATRACAGERLCRVVCADASMTDAAGITAIAEAVARGQVAQIRDGLAAVRARHPTLRAAVVAGLGAWLAAEAARAEGLEVHALADQWGEGSVTAPAAAVALLLDAAP